MLIVAVEVINLPCGTSWACLQIQRNICTCCKSASEFCACTGHRICPLWVTNCWSFSGSHRVAIDTGASGVFNGNSDSYLQGEVALVTYQRECIKKVFSSINMQTQP